MADRISYGPFTLYESDAYKRAKELEGAKRELEYQKTLLDVQEKMRETPEAKIATAEDMAMRIEALKQKKEGIKFGDVAKKAALEDNLSLLEAGKLQGRSDIENRMLSARSQAMENILTGGQGLVPTAKVDVGGITQTVPSESAPMVQADTQTQVYNASVPKFKSIFMSQGYSEQDAARMAADSASKEIIKNSNSGKISVLLPDQSILSLDLQKAMQMAKDPSTSPAIKKKLVEALGDFEPPKASAWINTRLGR